VSGRIRGRLYSFLSNNIDSVDVSS
jgi:hypothetical protein